MGSYVEERLASIIATLTSVEQQADSLGPEGRGILLNSTKAKREAIILVAERTESRLKSLEPVLIRE